MKMLEKLKDNMADAPAAASALGAGDAKKVRGRQGGPCLLPRTDGWRKVAMFTMLRLSDFQATLKRLSSDFQAPASILGCLVLSTLNTYHGFVNWTRGRRRARGACCDMLDAGTRPSSPIEPDLIIHAVSCWQHSRASFLATTTLPHTRPVGFSHSFQLHTFPLSPIPHGTLISYSERFQSHTL